MNEEYNYSYNTVIATNIKVDRRTAKNEKCENAQIPYSVFLDLPENITNMFLTRRYPENECYEILESFAYNALTKRFGMEVTHLQLYIPFDEEERVTVDEFLTEDDLWRENEEPEEDYDYYDDDNY